MLWDKLEKGGGVQRDNENFSTFIFVSCIVYEGKDVVLKEVIPNLWVTTPLADK